MTKGKVRGQVLCRQNDPALSPAGSQGAFRGGVTAGGREVYGQRLCLPEGPA